MKLSKNNLKALLRHSAWDELSDAMDNGTLEIEGYIRADNFNAAEEMMGIHKQGTFTITFK